MRKIVIATLALSAAVPLGPVTTAGAATVTYEGGCGFDANNDPSGEIANPDTYTGMIYAAVVAVSDNPAENPLSVSVTCLLKVNGTVVDATTFTGTGVAIGADDTSYVRHDGDVVEMCDHVVAGGTDFGESCRTVDHFDIPPQEFWDALDGIWSSFDGILPCRFMGPLARAALPPGDVSDIPGIFEWVPPDPDLYVLGQLWIDCPPYEF